MNQTDSSFYILSNNFFNIGKGSLELIYNLKSFND